jgi:Flp pilus assembly protein TadD
MPDGADLHSALGLSLVRQQRHAEAVAELARAFELARDDPRHAYLYAVALHDTGAAARALDVLEAARRRHPGDPDLQQALDSYKEELKKR